MRYIFLNEISKSEKELRQKYLYDTFKLFFIELNGNKHIEFVSIPSNANDCILIYGHNNKVNNFLNSNTIAENKILLITCNKDLTIPYKIRKKEIHISKNNSEITYCYDGRQYGFDFDVTDSEILLFRYRNSNFCEQINRSFERMMF